MGGPGAQAVSLFSEPTVGPGESLVESVFQASLPARRCTVCNYLVARRAPRVQLRASWRDHDDILCPSCWRSICNWAQRFALLQLSLPLP